MNNETDSVKPTRTSKKATDDGNLKKKKPRFFETYIAKIVKTLPRMDSNIESKKDTGITSNAKQQLNNAIRIITKQLASLSTYLTIISGKKTMSVKEVKTAVTLKLPSFFHKSIEEAEEKVSKYLQSRNVVNDEVKDGNESEDDDENSDNENDEKKVVKTNKHSSRQQKAGILFPPSIAEKFLRNFGNSKIMITRGAPIFFAYILEIVTKELLLTASTKATENSHVRVTIRDLELSVQTNEHFADLFREFKVSFIGGGVVPNIHDSLFNKKAKKKKTTTDKTSGDKKPHRFRPGTVSLREIKKLQKTSNCLVLSKFPFERLVRGVVNDLTQCQDGNKMKISKDVFIVLQYYIEQVMVDFLRDSNNAAIFCNRVKLMPCDINFINDLRKYKKIDPEPYVVYKETDNDDGNEEDHDIGNEEEQEDEKDITNGVQTNDSDED